MLGLVYVQGVKGRLVVLHILLLESDFQLRLLSPVRGKGGPDDVAKKVAELIARAAALRLSATGILLRTNRARLACDATR